MHIREATRADVTFLRRMWHMAAFWQPQVYLLTPAEAMQVPEIAMYIKGWGREGDVALIASDDRELGAAWYRTFPAHAPGYGFVDPETPEIALAVEPAARERGVGAALLDALIERARSDGVAALSLSVNAENPSRRLYLRAGFIDVTTKEFDSHVMLLRL